MRRRFAARGLALVLPVLALAACVSTPAAPTVWEAKPDAQALAGAYPGFAEDAGIEGWARIECRVVDRALRDCVTVEESPDGVGLGAAALSMADRFRLAADGRERVAFPIHFGLPPYQAPAPWTGSEPSAEALAVARTVASRLDLSLTRGSSAVRLEGLAEDRRPAVAGMIAAVEAETGPELREAYALHLARTQSVETLRMLTVGQRRPPRPALTDEEIERSRDRLAAAGHAQNERLKALYCERYRC